jgi:hypothetical protein
MGGRGSGNRLHPGAKSTTDDYRTLDVRRWSQEGMVRPGYCGGWQWTRNGEIVASIWMRAETGHVVLTDWHRSESGGMGGRTVPGAHRANAVQLWRLALMVHLPSARLRSARGYPLRRGHLRLSALLPSRLHQLTRGRGRPCSKTRGQAPRAPRLEARCPQWGGRKGEMDAVADLRTAGG